MSQWEKIYGIHAVEALLNYHPKRVKQLFILEGRQDPKIQHIIELAKKNHAKILISSRDELNELTAEDAVHQGVVAEVSPSQVWNEAMLEELLEKLAEPSLLLVLDNITDHQAC